MRILVVDDSEFFHPQIKAFLALAGFTDLAFAKSAQECLGLLPPRSGRGGTEPEFDLVLMDIMMPEVDGVEAIRRLKAEPVNQDLPVMVITADTSQETLRQAFEAGAVDHITKPLNPVELIARVRSILRLKSESDRRRAHEANLKRVNEELAQAHQCMLREMDLAGRLQARLLPRQSPLVPGLAVDALYRPSGQASGDYYDHFPVADRTVRLVAADVSGHGAGAAVLMAIVRTVFRLSRDSGLDLTQTVGNLNEHLLETIGDGADYVTLIAADLDLGKGELSWLNAGHPPGLVRDGHGKIRRLEPLTPPLGISPLEFAPRTESLDQGRLLFFTDGFYEFQTRPGQWFSLEPFLLLCEGLMDRDVSPLGELERRILDLTTMDPTARDLATDGTGKRPEFTDDLTALWARW